MGKSAKRIGEILVEKGFITQAQLQDGLSEQKMTGVFLGEILVKMGWLTTRHLLEALSEQFGIPLANLKDERIDIELAQKFSSSLIIDHRCFPLYKDEHSITVAIVNPLNAAAMSKIEEESQPLKVNFVLAPEEDLKEFIQKYRQQISQNILRMLKKDKKE